MQVGRFEYGGYVMRNRGLGDRGRSSVAIAAIAAIIAAIIAVTMAIPIAIATGFG